MSNNKCVVIRADASPTVGIGHVMRMYALASAFQATDWEVILCFKQCPPQILSLFDKKAISVAQLNCKKGSTIADEGALFDRLCRQHCANLVILDGYQFTFEYQSIMSRDRFKLMLMDDFGHRDKFSCDLLVNQNFGAEKLDYAFIAPETKLLLGNQYILIRPEIMLQKEHRQHKQTTTFNILVSLGGADYHNVSAFIINSLHGAQSILTKLKSKIVVTVVAGSANLHIATLQQQIGRLNQSSDLEFTLLTDIIDLSAQIAAANLLISAGGGTVWEAACLATANMVVITATNQAGIARFAEAGAIFNLGDASLLSQEIINRALEQFVFSDQFRTMPTCASKLVDGLGAYRIVKAIESI